jgi:hypothetical protein
VEDSVVLAVAEVRLPPVAYRVAAVRANVVRDRTMIGRVVTYARRYKRPPRKRQAPLDGPAVVKRGRRTESPPPS